MRYFRRLLKDASNWGELRHTPYGMTPALLISAVAFFQLLDVQGFALAGPEIVRDLDVPLTALIGLRGIVAFFSIFAGIGIGWFLDRRRRLPFYAVGTALSGVFSMTASRASSLFTLGTARVLDDVADELSDVPTYSLMADYYPPESRGRVFAMRGVIQRAGLLMAPVIVGVLMNRLGWRTVTFMFGVPLVLIAVVVVLAMREPVRGYMERRALGLPEEMAQIEDERLSFGEAWRTIWAVRTVRRVFIAQLWLFGGITLFEPYLGFLLADRYGLDPAERGFVSVLPVIAGLVGGYFGGGLIDTFMRRNPGRVLIIFGGFYAAAAFGVLGITTQPPLAFLIGFSALNAFGLGLSGPAVQVVFSQVIPASVRTQGLQVLALSRLPAILIFTPFGTTLFGNYGFGGPMGAAAVLMFLGGVVIMTASAFFDIDIRATLAQALANDEWRRASESDRAKLLVCRGIDVDYDGVQVLFDVDFDVEEGQTIALLGTNGAGKSTLLKAISGTQEASSGSIVFDGRDITHMPPHEIAARGVIHMPGGRGVFPTLSVRENLLLGRWMEDDTPAIAHERLEEVYEIFPMLQQRANEPAGALSGGEQQQLSLAQAFLGNPRLLMIDELSLGLSPAVVAQLLDIVREIQRRGVTIIIVEQSVNVALTIADRCIFMEKGEVRFFGETQTLLQRPDILRAVYVKGTGALTEGPAVRTRSALAREQELAASRPILEADGLTKRFGGVTAVDDVSFGLREGEVLGLIGPNGSGKTTTFDLISGYQIPDAGRVRYDGVDISDLTPEERSRRKLIRRFQDGRLFPSLTVHETLLVALDQKADVRNPAATMAQLPAARRSERRLRARADRLVELLALEAYREKFVRELSTGLRRIVDLACVLAVEPRVLLLDEPSSGIAQAEAEALAPLLQRVRRETGCSVLIIEHVMPLISAVSDELIALDQGRIVLRGTPEVVLNDDRVIESYLGTNEAAVNRTGVLT